MLLTVLYLFLLFPTRQYRHLSALLRLVFLASLLLLLQQAPEMFLAKQQHLFVLVDTSKSMQAVLDQSTSIQSTIEDNYSDYEIHYYDLYQPDKELTESNWPNDIQWQLQSPILSQILHFLKVASPPENSRLLLVSDGHDTENLHIPNTFQTQLQEYSLTLDTLILETPPSSGDLEISQVSNPRVVFTKTPATIQVAVRSNLETPQTSTLILTDGQAILHKKTLDFPSGEHDIQTELTWTPSSPGNTFLFLRLVPLQEEINLHNNVAYIPTTIRSKRMKVLHIAGRPSWDVRYLRGLLKEMPDVDMVAFYILRDPYRDSQTVPERELALIQFPVKELFQTELFKFDTVVFHNFAIQSYLFNPVYQQSFQKYLASGKKIVVVGGEQALNQQKYKQLFLKPNHWGRVNLQFYSLQSKSPIQSDRLLNEYLIQQPSFPSLLNEPSSISHLVRRTHFDQGQVDWIHFSNFWQKQHLGNPDNVGQSGDFAAFWQTLLYQPEYEKLKVFRDFRQSLPYITEDSIAGSLHLPTQPEAELPEVHLQVLDQLLNVVVWEKPLPVEQYKAHLQLPRLSPSFYEMRLTCRCNEMADMSQSLTIVDEWLELRSTTPNVEWLQELARLSEGETVYVAF